MLRLSELAGHLIDLRNLHTAILHARLHFAHASSGFAVVFGIDKHAGQVGLVGTLVVAIGLEGFAHQELILGVAGLHHHSLSDFSESFAAQTLTKECFGGGFVLFGGSVLESFLQAGTTGRQTRMFGIESFQFAVFIVGTSEVAGQLQGASQTEVVFGEQWILCHLPAPNFNQLLTSGGIARIADDCFAQRSTSAGVVFLSQSQHAQLAMGWSEVGIFDQSLSIPVGGGGQLTITQSHIADFDESASRGLDLHGGLVFNRCAFEVADSSQLVAGGDSGLGVVGVTTHLLKGFTEQTTSQSVVRSGGEGLAEKVGGGVEVAGVQSFLTVGATRCRKVDFVLLVAGLVLAGFFVSSNRLGPATCFSE